MALEGTKRSCHEFVRVEPGHGVCPCGHRKETKGKGQRRKMKDPPRNPNPKQERPRRVRNRDAQEEG